MNIVFVGHVDHGKSTLIGRLLAETHALPQGKLETLQRFCEQNSKPFEYAFLLDALSDEQAQGITIDIARCFFSTHKRRYLILDAPGHIEFLKNLITGAANAEAAFLVIDAQEGVQENSRRHAYMLSLLGVSQVVVLVNKMDLTGYSEDVFNAIKNELAVYLKQIHIEPISYIPLSGRKGDNITSLSHQMPWYKEKTLIETLDELSKQAPDKEQAFRMPVQDIYKFTLGGDNRRIIAGQVLTGALKVGDQVIFYPSEKQGTVKTIEAFNQPPLFSVDAGCSTGFTLHEQWYIKRGEVACLANQKKPHVASTLVTLLFWLGHTPLQTRKVYWFKLGTSRVKATVEKIENVFDTASLNVIEKVTEVKANQAAECTLKLESPIAFDDTQTNKVMARFVLIDHYDIAGGGTIKNFIPDSTLNQKSHLLHSRYIRALSKLAPVRKVEGGSEHRTGIYTLVHEDSSTEPTHKFSTGVEFRKSSIVSHQSLITPEERRQYYQQESNIIWFTGLSGSGKTTLATSLEKKLIEARKITCLLDGDSLRKGLNADLDFSDNARKENIRRIAELATYLGKQGMIVLVSAISPHRHMRQFAREQAEAAGIRFVEVYVKATLQTCQARDPKKLYKAAMDGTVKSLSGIDSVYEAPENPELIIETDNMSIENSVDLIASLLPILHLKP